MDSIEQLKKWFLDNRRDFPWRKEKSPYRVWISEVMLQQTRALVVVDYFEKWIKLFPTPLDLAKAPLEKVIKAWEGLGYYRRARALHEAAQEMVDRFDGKVPSTYEELKSLPGLGPYTIGAILNFGFHKKALAIDGNVIRVLSRYFGIEKEISKAATRREMEENLFSILPEKEPWIISEALIELGALVCKPKPLCSFCPLAFSCKALEKQNQEELPIKKAKKEMIFLERVVVVIEAEGSYLVAQESEKKVMQGLYQFPYFEKKDFCDKILEKSFGKGLDFIQKIPKISHSFTIHKVDLFPIFFRMRKKREILDWIWVEKKRLEELAFSSGHRKIVQEIMR